MKIKIYPDTTKNTQFIKLVEGAYGKTPDV